MDIYDIFEIIEDYDIVVCNPKEHIPYAMFALTEDAVKFKKKLEIEKPEENWIITKLSDWRFQYKQ